MENNGVLDIPVFQSISSALNYKSCEFSSDINPISNKFEIDFKQNFDSYFRETSNELPKSMSTEPEVHKLPSKPITFDKPPTEVKFEIKEPDMHKRNFRPINIEKPVVDKVKPPAIVNEGFKVPFKSSNKAENGAAKRFTLKREAVSKLEPESKNPKTSIPASPLPNIKSRPFTSASRPSTSSKPLLKPQTPSVPSFISAQECSTFISSYEEDKNLISDLQKTFDQLETLKTEENYESLSEMLALKDHLPSLTLRALKIRYTQVLTMNQILNCEIPELKPLNKALADFDKEHNIG